MGGRATASSEDFSILKNTHIHYKFGGYPFTLDSSHCKLVGKCDDWRLQLADSHGNSFQGGGGSFLERFPQKKDLLHSEWKTKM